MNAFKTTRVSFRYSYFKIVLKKYVLLFGHEKKRSYNTFNT